jgi:membrane-bound ClpP family serine protease
MNSIKGYSAGFFIFAVSVLSVISVLGVWGVLEGDVIYKSFQTLGLLAVVAAIVMIAGRAMDARSTSVIYVPNPAWSSVRRGTLILLIVLVSILAFMGVLTIWDIISNKDVLYKSLGSVAILAFASLIIVGTCRTMEGNSNPSNQ